MKRYKSLFVFLMLIPILFFAQEAKYQEVFSTFAIKPNGIFVGDHSISIAEGCDDGGPYCCFKEVILSNYTFNKENIEYTMGVLPKEELDWDNAKLSCQGPQDKHAFQRMTVNYEKVFQVLGDNYKAGIKRVEYDEKSSTGTYLVRVTKGDNILIEETVGPGEDMYGGEIQIADFDWDGVPEILFYYVSATGTMLSLNVRLYSTTPCKYENLNFEPGLEQWEYETACHYDKRLADRYPKRIIPYGCLPKSGDPSKKQTNVERKTGVNH